MIKKISTVLNSIADFGNYVRSDTELFRIVVAWALMVLVIESTEHFFIKVMCMIYLAVFIAGDVKNIIRARRDIKELQ